MRNTGRISYNAAQRSVRREMKSGGGLLPGFARYKDCAVYQREDGGELVTSVFSGIVPERELTELYFSRGCNELWCEYAGLRLLSAAVVLPAEWPESWLAETTRQLAKLCREEGASFAQCQATVSASVKVPVLTLSFVGERGKGGMDDKVCGKGKEEEPACPTGEETGERAGRPDHAVDAGIAAAGHVGMAGAGTVALDHAGLAGAGIVPAGHAGMAGAGTVQVGHAELAGAGIVALGHAGMAGAALISRWRREELGRHYAAGFLDGAADFWRELRLSGSGLCVPRQELTPSCAQLPPACGGGPLSGEEYLFAVQEGGVFAALWYLADGLSLGFEIDLKKIPIRQETVEICEFYRLNPYQLAGDGMVLAVSRTPEKLARECRAAGREAAVLGFLTKGKGRILRNAEEVRYLDKPAGDELEKITGFTESIK